mgnify:FL=1
MSVDYGAIGQRIKQKRKAAGKTQDNLAESLSVSVGYISQLERGITKISLDTLSKIAEIFECDLADFVSDVTPSQDSYLDAEMQSIYQEMGYRKKQLLLEIAKMLTRY